MKATGFYFGKKTPLTQCDYEGKHTHTHTTHIH